MIDIKYLCNNLAEIELNIKQRKLKNTNVRLVRDLYNQWLETNRELETTRNKRNIIANKMKTTTGSVEERNELINKGKTQKEKADKLNDLVVSLKHQYTDELKKIPNMTHHDVPIGKENQGKVLGKYGTKRKFDFPISDHVTLGKELDLIDFDNATNVTGTKFYYLKNEAALLELALINYSIQKLVSKGFIPCITPDLAKSHVLEAIGFNPRGDETQVYSIHDSSLCLIGTSEITLGGLLQNQIISKDNLPLCYGGFSHCFRTEAGGAGLATKGLYRVHQFSKVEMFAFTTAENSNAMHDKLKDIEIEIFEDLGIHFQVVDIATGDLGNPAYRKYDLEAWIPSRNEYCEITSTSNCTDYQSRRLNIHYRDSDGKKKLVHTLNGTACAVPRVIIAILENYQQSDGTVVLPHVLQPYMNNQTLITKKKS